MERIIFHIDVNSAFLSWEAAKRVKNGEKSLALVNDYSRTGNMGWKSLALKGLGIDLTDAVRVGFWMYVPKEATGMCEVDFNNSIVVDVKIICTDIYSVKASMCSIT